MVDKNAEKPSRSRGSVRSPSSGNRFSIRGVDSPKGLQRDRGPSFRLNPQDIQGIKDFKDNAEKMFGLNTTPPEKLGEQLDGPKSSFYMNKTADIKKISNWNPPPEEDHNWDEQNNWIVTIKERVMEESIDHGVPLENFLNRGSGRSGKRSFSGLESDNHNRGLESDRGSLDIGQNINTENPMLGD